MGGSAKEGPALAPWFRRCRLACVEETHTQWRPGRSREALPFQAPLLWASGGPCDILWGWLKALGCLDTGGFQLTAGSCCLERAVRLPAAGTGGKFRADFPRGPGCKVCRGALLCLPGIGGDCSHLRGPDFPLGLGCQSRILCGFYPSLLVTVLGSEASWA